jgi:hypothetical protein
MVNISTKQTIISLIIEHKKDHERVISLSNNFCNQYFKFHGDICLMVFNATFNNISVISWRSVLLVEEKGGPGENH